MNVSLRPAAGGDASTLYSVPPPGSGALLGFMLNVLDNFHLDESSLATGDDVRTYQLITETFKQAYALRTRLGDSEYQDVGEVSMVWER